MKELNTNQDRYVIIWNDKWYVSLKEFFYNFRTKELELIEENILLTGDILSAKLFEKQDYPRKWKILSRLKELYPGEFIVQKVNIITREL